MDGGRVEARIQEEELQSIKLKHIFDSKNRKTYLLHCFRLGFVDAASPGVSEAGRFHAVSAPDLGVLAALLSGHLELAAPPAQHRQQEVRVPAVSAPLLRSAVALHVHDPDVVVELQNLHLTQQERRQDVEVLDLDLQLQRQQPPVAVVLAVPKPVHWVQLQSLVESAGPILQQGAFKTMSGAGYCVRTLKEHT
jgi:hypothetical protein